MTAIHAGYTEGPPPEPWYLVIFESGHVDLDYRPITFAAHAPADVTQPHGLDREIIPALDAVWFALHLPRRVHDTLDIPLRPLRIMSSFNLAHQITLFPSPLLDNEEWQQRLAGAPPAVIFVPNSLLVQAEAFGQHIGVRIKPVAWSELSNDTLRELWLEIGSTFRTDARRLLNAPPLTARTTTGATLLPALQFGRQLAAEDRLMRAAHHSSLEVLKTLVDIQVTVATLEQAERAGYTRKTVKAMPRELRVQALRSVRLEGIIGAPGAAPHQRRRVSLHLGARVTPGDLAAEDAVIETIVAHRASARSTLATITPPLPASVFHTYSALEAHCSAAGRPRAHVTWKMLRELGDILARQLGPEAEYVIRNSKALTTFSDFPLGLAILPGDTAPLSCRMPVTQLPLTPLTRRLQYELAPSPRIDWTAGIDILIAECLNPNDRIYAPSLSAWTDMSNSINTSGRSKCTVVNITDERHLSSVLQAHQYDVLVLSAHGRYLRRENTAQVYIRDTPTLLLDVGHVPPLVVLSACHVAPRAVGAVTVADLLFRHGARAVVGTLVPIDVVRNAFLMNRFFTYLCDAIEERTAFDTLQELWHHVISSNAVHDIYAASKRLQRWAFTPKDGVWADKEFKNIRSVGRLRANHIYRDTEDVLLEIAKDRGFESTLRGTLLGQGYSPESLFYVLLGDASRFVLSRRHRDLLTGTNPEHDS